MRTRKTVPGWLPRTAQKLSLIATAIALTITASLLVVATPAGATIDVGDGLLSCNVGEICFKKNVESANRYLKHFWYSQRHDGFNFTDNGGVVAWNVSMVANRDTECDIYVQDGYGSSVKWSRGDTRYYSWAAFFWWNPALGASWNDANYAHSRCSVHTNWGT